MTKIVGIQFNNSGRVYYFAPGEFDFKVGDTAIVETVRGLELGNVAIATRTVEDSEVEYELKPVVRKGTEEDEEQYKVNIELAKEAFEIFKKYVKKLGLPMKPLYSEYTIDQSKVLFYYESEERVDFRELLKYLTPQFHIRVELRQIGSREAARILGGIGNCGRELCCKTCLRDFDFVTMKMAKDQSMSLNSSKISGLCGKLMCCIAYENEMYQQLKKELPSVGNYVKTPSCDCCKIISVDYMKKTVRTQENPTGAPTTHPASDVQVVPSPQPHVEGTHKQSGDTPRQDFRRPQGTRPQVDKQHVDKQPVDKQPVDKQPVDKQPVDKQPGDKQPVEKPQSVKPQDGLHKEQSETSNNGK
jgi:cell fate regulator YaaT (PSP1 superfamily)